MTKNIVAVDIGNTSTTIGFFTGKRLRNTYLVKTTQLKRKGWEKALRRDIQKKHDRKPEAVVISSVVPSQTNLVVGRLSSFSQNKPLIIGKDIVVPIRNCCRYPRQVGQDRLVNAVAGYYLYGGPLIIVDLGTAITIDLVSKNGEFLGGIISPGIGIALQALHQKTALLPLVELSCPGSILGKDTVSSMKSGVVIGYSCLVDGLVNRLKKKYAKNARIVATGGYLTLMRRWCQSLDILNKTLTLQGIKITYETKK